MERNLDEIFPKPPSSLCAPSNLKADFEENRHRNSSSGVSYLPVSYRNSGTSLYHPPPITQRAAIVIVAAVTVPFYRHFFPTYIVKLINSLFYNQVDQVPSGARGRQRSDSSATWHRSLLLSKRKGRREGADRVAKGSRLDYVAERDGNLSTTTVAVS